MLKYLFFLLALIVFGTVFITLQNIPYGVIEGKNFGFVIASTLTGIGFLTVLLFCKNYKLQVNYIDIFLCLYLLWCTFNYFILKTYYSSIGINTLICVILLSLMYKQLIVQHNYYTSFYVVACLLIGGGQAILGLLQLYGYQQSLHTGYKMTGSFHNPGPYGIYIAAIFVFALGNYLYGKNQTLKNIAAFACVLCVLVLPSTQSRSAWVGAAIGALYLLFTKYGLVYVKKYFTNTFFNIAMVTILFTIGVMLYSFKPNSALGRVLTWQVSLEMVKNNSLTGIGYDQFANKYGFYQASFFKNNPNHTTFATLADKNGYAFNDLLQILVENGIIGFVLFILVIYFTFFTATHKNATDISYASKAGIITLLCACIFSYPLQLIPITWLLLFFIALISAQSRQKFSFAIPLPTKIFGVIGFSFLLLFILKNTLNEYQTKQIWQQADDAVALQDFKKAEKIYRIVLLQQPNLDNALLGYGKTLYINGKIQESVNVLEKASKSIADPFLYSNLADSYTALKKYNLAEKAYLTSIAIIPNRMYPKYLLAKMYLQKQDTVKAKAMAKQILAMPIKTTSLATTDMLAEMKKVVE